MSRNTAQKIVHLCTTAAILSGLLSIGHLSWAECVRLLLVLGAVGVLYLRYREEIHDRVALPAAPVLLALLVVFAQTQFDPATSSIGYRLAQEGMGAVFVTTTGLAIFAGVVTLLAYRDRVGWRALTALDRTVVGVVIGGCVLSLGSRELIGSGQRNLVGAVKLLSYGVWWIAITRAYTDPDWQETRSRFWGRWIAPLIALVIVFVPSIVYGGYRTVSVMTHLAKGREAYEAQDWDDARKNYEAADRLNKTVDYGPARDRYLEDLAVLQFRLGDEKAAKAQINRLMNATLDRTDAHQKAGDVYLWAERWTEAVRSYERVLEKRPTRAVQDAAGVAYHRMGDSRNFLELTNRFGYLPNIDPRTFDELIFLGNVQFYREQFGSALDYYRQAAELNKEDAYAEYKVGRAYFEQSNIVEAVVQFRRAVELDPKFADAHYRVGLCLEVQGDTVSALSEYKRTVELLPNHLHGSLSIERLGGSGGVGKKQ